MYFGDLSLEVNISNFNPDVLGVYASSSSTTGKKSVVIVNKDPSNPVGLSLSSVPEGEYILRHFGGLAGVAKWQVSSGRLLVLHNLTFV